MRQVVRLGLVRRSSHASPIVSNYPINWLMMYSDLKHFGYNPYAPEFADLIREGKAEPTPVAYPGSARRFHDPESRSARA